MAMIVPLISVSLLLLNNNPAQIERPTSFARTEDVNSKPATGDGKAPTLEEVHDFIASFSARGAQECSFTALGVRQVEVSKAYLRKASDCRLKWESRTHTSGEGKENYATIEESQEGQLDLREMSTEIEEIDGAEGCRGASRSVEESTGLELRLTNARGGPYKLRVRRKITVKKNGDVVSAAPATNVDDQQAVLFVRTREDARRMSRALAAAISLCGGTSPKF